MQPPTLYRSRSDPQRFCYTFESLTSRLVRTLSILRRFFIQLKLGWWVSIEQARVRVWRHQIHLDLLFSLSWRWTANGLNSLNAATWFIRFERKKNGLRERYKLKTGRQEVRATDMYDMADCWVGVPKGSESASPAAGPHGEEAKKRGQKLWLFDRTGSGFDTNLRGGKVKVKKQRDGLVVLHRLQVGRTTDLPGCKATKRTSAAGQCRWRRRKPWQRRGQNRQETNKGDWSWAGMSRRMPFQLSQASAHLFFL